MRPRQALFRQRKALSLALLAALVGCSTPASQLRQCQQEKEQLLAAIQKQRQTAEALRDKVASLEERLDQAEKELARGAASTRLSSRPQNPPLAADAASRSSASPPASDAALSWRAPPGKAPDGKSANPSSSRGSPDNKESLPGSGSPARPLPPRNSSEQGAASGRARPTGVSRQEPYRVRPAATTTEDAPAARMGDFSASTRPAPRTIHSLLASDGRCEYDPQVGAYRLRMPLSFRDGATLTAESKQQLDELARWLNRPQMRDVRVLVTGYVEGRPSADENGGRPTTAREQSLARAAAVADYLDRHGIAHERLGISAVGSRGPIGQPGPSPNASGGVQIFLVEPEAPVIGWGPTGHAIRR